MKRIVLGTIVALLSVAFAATAVSGGDNMPSSKTSATSVQAITVPSFSGSEGTEILSTRLKTAQQKELVITVSAESMLMNAERIAGAPPPAPPVPPSSNTSARLIFSVLVDGALARPGSVIWNDRIVTVQQPAPAGSFVYQYETTRSSNSFTFIAVNVPAGVHTVAVKAWREGYATPSGGTQPTAGWTAYVGKRTLVVEETQMAKPVEPAADAAYPSVSGGPGGWAILLKGYLWLGDCKSAELTAEWGSTPSPPSGPIPLPNTTAPVQKSSDGQFSFGPIPVGPSGPTIYWWRAKIVYDGGEAYSGIVGTSITPAP